MFRKERFKIYFFLKKKREKVFRKKWFIILKEKKITEFLNDK